MSRYIYKICPTDLYEEAVKAGVFNGAGIDLQDGYIHFSTAAQTAETLALHFAGQEGLSLIEVVCDNLEIKWEQSRGGQYFPHLYDAMPMSAVSQSWDLTLDEAGTHRLPELTDEKET